MVLNHRFGQSVLLNMSTYLHFSRSNKTMLLVGHRRRYKPMVVSFDPAPYPTANPPLFNAHNDASRNLLRSFGKETM